MAIMPRAVARVITENRFEGLRNIPPVTMVAMMISVIRVMR
jgi:hypothetical protein